MTEIDLLEDYGMPTFSLLGLEALFDTGASKCVCNLSQNIFELIFVNNFKDKRNGEVFGFGGTEPGKDYTILSLNIGGIQVNNVTFFVPDNPIVKYKFIIAGTVFAKYPYRIDMPNHCLTIEN